MTLDLKNIHIGILIKQRIEEVKMNIDRICKYMNYTEQELTIALAKKNLTSDIILKFSILLEYDFFRIYSHYLILYSPPAKNNKEDTTKSSLPQFRKNLYTQEIIYFILDLINSGKKSKQQVIDEYRIPKTTLYKWISKYNNKVS